MAAPGENLRINPDRLWDSLMEMAKIGPGVAGGNNRQTLTDEDGEGRHLFKRWCEGAGLDVAVDQMGTMFARREGTDPDALPVYVGSHLDTQPTGGKFDGVLGVLGGLEVIRTLDDLGIRTKHPIVVTNWTNEEGTRFAPAMLASGVFAGVHEQDWAYDRKDAKGKRFGDELERIGWKGDEEVGQRKMKAFFELHIEQGPILEDEGIDIGVVTHGQGLKWLQVTLTGKESHTGSTPMPKRRNAGLGMARVTELVHEVAMDYQPDAVGAIGHMEVYPNSRNIIAGKTVFTIDIRSPEKEVLDAMDQRIREGIDLICEALDIKYEIEQVGHFDPVTFDETCVKAVRDAAERLGYTHRNIVSGAGHDACWINRVAPTAMVFCPCVDGLSHNEAEDISKEWAAAGADVLFHAVVETAEIVPELRLPLMEQPIVIAAAVLLDRDGRMLTVRKRGTVEFMQPGGKIDAGETPAQALARELLEEIGVTLPDFSQVSDHGVFRAPAAHQPGRTVEAHVFAFGHDRPVAIAGEIEELAWVDPHAPADLPLAALTRDFMLPLARSLTRER